MNTAAQIIEINVAEVEHQEVVKALAFEELEMISGGGAITNSL